MEINSKESKSHKKAQVEIRLNSVNERRLATIRQRNKKRTEELIPNN